MVTSVTQFSRLAVDDNGNVLPLGLGRIACQVRTSDGAFAALDPSARMIRVATNAAIHMDIAGGPVSTADELIMPGVEYFAVNGGEVLGILTVV